MNRLSIEFVLGDANTASLEHRYQARHLYLIPWNRLRTKNNMVTSRQTHIWMAVLSEAIERCAHLALASCCDSEHLVWRHVAEVIRLHEVKVIR